MAKTAINFKRRSSELTDRQHQHIVKLLTYMLDTCSLSGEYTVNAAGKAVTGRGNKTGVIIGSANEHGVAFTYQPSGEKKKYQFRIALGLDEAKKVQKTLKAKFSQEVRAVPKKKVAQKLPAEKPTSKPEAAPKETSNFIENFTATNAEHAIAFAKVAEKIAQNYADAVLPKSEMANLLADFMGTVSKAVGPQVKSLVSRGYLVRYGEDGFLVDPNPSTQGQTLSKRGEDKPKVSKSQKATSVPTLSEPMRRVFEDTVRMQTFFAACVQRFAAKEYINHEDFYDLMNEMLLPGMHRVTHRTFVRYLREVGYLDRIKKGKYRLTENALRKFKVLEVVQTVDKESDDNDLVKLPVPMQRTLRNKTAVATFCLGFADLQDGLSPLKITDVESLLVDLYPSGHSDWTHKKLVSGLVKLGYLKRASRYQLTLDSAGEELVKKARSATQESEVSKGDSTQEQVTAASEDLSETNKMLAEAVRVKQRLEQELKEANGRADAAEAQCADLETRIADLEAQARKQPDIKAEIQAGVRAELKRLLST